MIVGKDTVMVRKRYDRRADIGSSCGFGATMMEIVGHCRPQEWGTRVTKEDFVNDHRPSFIDLANEFYYADQNK